MSDIVTGREPRPVRIRFDYPLGDLVVLGGVLRELHRSHPGAFAVTVESSLEAYWAHCPHARHVVPGPGEPPGSGTQVIEGLYEAALAGSRKRPRHLLEALAEGLAENLGVRIPIGDFRGEALLAEGDDNKPGPVEVALGSSLPYWIVCNGGKFDRTVKWWPDESYQRVVDAFRGTLLFVQVGRATDYHPRLKGALDLRGGTDLATLVRLVHHADGVLSPITSLMHLAAAVPRPAGRPGLRPCVVVAGGIEPAHLTAYPGHRFLSTVGSLACTGEGCWRSRTFPIGDGDAADAADRLCETPDALFPRCQRLIRPDDVIRSIGQYREGGTIRCLTPAEADQVRSRVEWVRGSALDSTQLTKLTGRLAVEREVRRLRGRRCRGQGRGVVTLASGIDYLASAWMMTGLQRHLGCRLPMEVWTMGEEDNMAVLRRAFGEFDVRVRIHRPPVDVSRPRSSMFAAKSDLIAASGFQEVLWLDADSFPVRDPSCLFELPEYRQHGAVLWPDIAECRTTTAQAWTLFGLARDTEGAEVQGGALLLDKSRVSEPLLLARWCNRHYGHLYDVMGGDKDVYRLAFRKMGQPFGMPPGHPALVDGCLFETDFSGTVLFQHRVAAKVRVGQRLATVRGFQHHDQCQALLDRFASEVAPGLAVHRRDAKPSVQTIPVAVECR